MPASTKLLNEYQKLQNVLTASRQALDGKETQISQMESKVRQGNLPFDNAANLKANLDSLPYFLRPGNVGQINEVIWPYYFSTPLQQVAPNQNVRSQFSVTQEAAFVLMAYTKTAFVQDEDGTITYIDPDDAATGGTPGLSFFYRDAVSSREFFSAPQNLDMVGVPRWPSILPAPQMFIPNSTVEVNYVNNNQTVTYWVQTQYFGYRLRLEKAQEILSLVGG